jgi:ankyrin repeat protein
LRREEWMKKVLVALGVCLFLAPVTFAQDFFELIIAGTPEQIWTATGKGAKIDERDKNGQTPLMLVAGFNSNPEVIKALLKAGANSKLLSNVGWTAFDYAEENKKVKGTDAYWELKNTRF